MRFSRTLALLAIVAATGCKDIGNKAPPQGDFEYTCDSYVCVFDATATQGEVDGNPGFTWDFGDGNRERGKRVQHAFIADGTFNVTLTVTDRLGNSSTTSKSLTIDSVEAAPYFTLVRSMFSGMVHSAETLRNFEAQAIPLQAEIEASVSPTSLPSQLQCPEAGDAEITSWEDNGNGSIDAGEELRIVANRCQFDSAHPPLDADLGMTVTGPVASGSYAISADERNRGLKTLHDDSYRLGGNFSVESSGSANERILQGTRVRFLHVNEAENATSEVYFSEPDLLVSFDLTRFIGKFRFSGQGINREWEARIEEEVELNSVNGSLVMTAGRIILEQDLGLTLILEPDADPAYLRVRVYGTDRVSPAIDGRLEQRLVVKRFTEF